MRGAIPNHIIKILNLQYTYWEINLSISVSTKAEKVKNVSRKLKQFIFGRVH